ncbi:amidohydrolase family protein [Brevibacillus choshinensis]|uniref:amidohydrolase family protein n=1 Tax=Brevibacillus choshinensis TaxID=54911 RepID=UPI002E203AB7|nr:amidohydrolase family protein [Brevibacillus choshinensis]MED4751049.1 amidohydrolase family protein [Brevibacillus choshinensis]
MSQQEMVIRGGLVVTSYGVREADIWVVDGKITRIAKDTLQKSSLAPPPVEVDATGMYLLPGFIGMPQLPLYRIRDRKTYMESLRSMIKMGCTSFVDTFYPDAWMNLLQVKYQQTPHFNSSIDYVWHVGLDVTQLNEGEVSKWNKRGYPALHVALRSQEDISSINWETISQLHTSNKTILHLHMLSGSSTKDQRERLRLSWMEATQYWKVRTVISESTAELDPITVDPYYHIFRLKKECTDRAMRLMYRNWFRTMPFIAPLNDVQIDYRRRWCQEEELLCLLVRLASTNVAKAVGLFPRKGALLPGSDADIVFLKKENWLTKYDVSTILNFSEKQLPASVMSNGKWIYRDTRFISSVGMGRCLFDTRPYTFVI